MKNYSITLPSYSIGDNVYSKIGEICEPYGKKVICIGGKTAISKVRDLIINECNGTSLEILDFLWYGGDATYENVNTLKENELVKKADIILVSAEEKRLIPQRHLHILQIRKYSLFLQSHQTVREQRRFQLCIMPTEALKSRFSLPLRHDIALFTLRSLQSHPINICGQVSAILMLNILRQR